MESRPKKLLDQVREAIRVKHYSYRTEESYVHWIRRYILFHNKQHPKDMGSAEVTAFLSHLAVEEHVAASTQNQAFSALLFMYRNVLQQDLNRPIDALRAKRSRYLPTVLARQEVPTVIGNLLGAYQLVVQVLYGSGLRPSEGLNLRVKDLDFAQHQIVVRDVKGHESQVTMLPVGVIAPLKKHLQWVKSLHE